MDPLVLLASLLAALCVVFVTAGLRSAVLADREKLSLRLSHGATPRAKRRVSATDVTWQQTPRTLLAPLERALQNIGWAQELQADLKRGEVNLYVSEYMGLRFGLAFLSAVLIAILGGNILFAFVGVLVALVVWTLPSRVLKHRVERRRRELEEQLDSALLSIASSLRSGFSFLQSCQLVLQQFHWPLKDEFSEMLEEVNLGASIDDALRNMSTRAQSYEVGIMVNAVLAQRTIGGNLSEILENVARTIRDRRELRGHIMALTAQQRLSAIFVAAVPVIMCAFLSLTAWEFMSPLFKTLTGNILLVIGTILDVLGFLVMRRLTRIDF